jgi:TRAP-type C4-dicarboxylate transport system substrate-binding protein
MGLRTVKADSSSTLLQFNSGALDAMYSSPLFVAALWSQYRRVVTHISAFKLSPFFGAILMNKRAWDNVPDSIKPALVEAAERVCREIEIETDRLEAEGIASMVKDGLIMPPYTERDKDAWDELYKSKVASVASEWYSPDFMAAIYAAMGR